MKINKILLSATLVTFLTLGVSSIGVSASGVRCTVYTALKHRAQPSMSATVLGIIYPGEYVYDYGLNDLCLSMDSEFDYVYRPSTHQSGYCDHHYLKY